MRDDTPRARRRHARTMTLGTGEPVTLRVGARRGTGEVRVARWDRSARLLRAARAWGFLWGLAAVSILVPVAHFVLVPGFLVAGPIRGVARYRQRSGILGGEGACPSCGARLTIEAREDRWPFLAYCGACQAALWVERSEART